MKTRSQIKPGKKLTRSITDNIIQDDNNDSVQVINLPSLLSIIFNGDEQVDGGDDTQQK